MSYENKVIIADTGFWLALGSRSDRYHYLASHTFQQISEPLVTTWPVVTETCYFLLKRHGNNAQIAFLSNISNDAFKIHDLTVKDTQRITRLMSQYSDLPMDFADASLIVLAEHLQDGRILSSDRRDFSTYRWNDNEPFENLML